MSDEPEVVDAEVVHEPQAEPTSEPRTSTALAPRERRSEVIRPLNADALVESFEQYQALLPKLLDEHDYQDAGRGKRFVKKSGWRKIATAFDLDVQIVRSLVERDGAGAPARAEVWARAIAPSGRFMDGDGYCSVDEERFSGPRGNRSKLENDLRATATTRAMNRAISGLVGMGEVSAEEVGGAAHDAGPAFGPAANDARQTQMIRALEFLLSDSKLATGAFNAIGARFNYVPEAAAVAIGLAAKQIKELKESSDVPSDAGIDLEEAAA